MNTGIEKEMTGETPEVHSDKRKPKMAAMEAMAAMAPMAAMEAMAAMPAMAVIVGGGLNLEF